MSHSFYLEPVNNLKYQGTIDSLDIPNVILTDDSPRPVNDDWPHGEAYLYIDNISVRPLEVTYTGETFQIRIFQASSLADYELAKKLAVNVAKKFGVKIHPEDNEDLSIDEFEKEYGAQWAKDHIDSMISMMVGMWMENKEGVSTMTGTRADMKAGPRVFESLLKDKENVVDNFLDRFRKVNYIDREDVYITPISVFKSQDDPAKEVRVAVYGEGVTTLLSDTADVIALPGKDGETLYIPIDKLAGILHEHAYWLTENLLLASAIEGENWKKLIAAAVPHAIDDIFSVAQEEQPGSSGSQRDKITLGGDVSSYQQVLTTDDWNTLLYCPFIVFLVVAGADGKIDRKEVEAFQKQLITGLVIENELLSEILIAGIKEAPRLLAEVLGGEIEPISTINNIKSIADEILEPEKANEFKLGLLYIGTEIAAASGGFLGVFGSKISKEEKQILAGLATMLNVSLPGEE